MIFPDIKAFKYHMREYAVLKKCMWKIKKTDPTRAYLKCKNKDCKWEVSARKLSTEHTIKVRTCNLKHTCPGLKKHKNPMCNSEFVKDYMLKKLGFSDEVPSAKRIHKEHIWPRFGVEIPKWLAAEAKTLILAKLHGTFEESYTKIPSLVKEVMNMDSENICSFTKSIDDAGANRF
ncbi:hypothetical protein MKW94_020693 [Papaver nudicaule]|uniref:Transposase MuDR plant domain-containing protein n=1 Tax=Papaver nudicaule TaxID=74823 RepID=A0AA42AWI3_PAPNU|nr:hypothetical protein [Papaver nudicaule]